jgi:hypothetical protein
MRDEVMPETGRLREGMELSIVDSLSWKDEFYAMLLSGNLD